VLVAAAALAAALVGASQVGGADDPEPSVPSAPSAVAAPSLFAGVEQDGSTLGSPTAPVTLVEYADLQCPYCAQWARDALPTVVKRYVRTDKVRIVFRGLAFIGPDSDTALRTAIAAGREDHLWDIVHGFFENQGTENAGWVTDELVTDIAADVPGLDGGRLIDTRWSDSVERELRRTAAVAHAAGIHGTPAFQIGRTGGRLELLELKSLGPEGTVPAIEAALAR
jgi:protein-disulfide isomerase